MVTATDALWNVLVAVSGDAVTDRHWLNVGWLTAYLLIAAAASRRAMVLVAEPAPPAETLVIGWRRVAGADRPVDRCGEPPHLGPRAVAGRQAARDQGRRLAVAILDLDHFKVFNDTFGHPAGDALLTEAVTAWRAALPAEAVLARYGGEEFAVLLPDHDVYRAQQVVSALAVHTPREQRFSAGVAEWGGGGPENPTALVAAADAALYRAKRGGRNQVRAAGTYEVTPGCPDPARGAPPRCTSSAAHPVTPGSRGPPRSCTARSQQSRASWVG